MTRQFEIKHSAASGSRPTTSSLHLGQLAINSWDGKVYFEKFANTTDEILELVSNNFSGSVAMSGSMVLDGALQLQPTSDPDPSGTNLTDTFLFVSSSNTSLGYDVYFRQDGNVVKWKWIESLMNTGILYGGVLSYSGSYFYVSSGSGIIVDHNATTSSEVSPIISYVRWNNITASILNTGSQNTFVYIDATGSLGQQTSFFTSQQYHEIIPIGRVSHYGITGSTVTGVSNNMVTAYDQIGQANEFIRAFGPLKISGLNISAQTGSLRISIGSGTAFNLGGFYQYNPEIPSIYNSNASATASIVRMYRSGSDYIFDNNGGAYYTTVDPANWDNGSGTLQSISNNNWSIQRVFTNPVTGRAHIYYSQTSPYATLAVALSNLSTEAFSESEVTKNSYVFSGFIIAKSNTTDLANTENSIIQGGLFRSISGGGSGGGGGTAGTLDDLTDVNITSPTNGQALIYNAGLWVNGTPLNVTSASYAATASSADNFLVRGTLTAQTIVAQTITSSTEFITGSTIFGSLLTDTHQFTGSVSITGSLNLTGNQIITGSLTVSGSSTLTNIGPAIFSGSLNVTQGITGSLQGTASWANNAITASYVLNAVSASFASTASYVLASNVVGFSNQIATGSISASVGFGTGSFEVVSGSTILLSLSSSGYFRVKDGLYIGDLPLNYAPARINISSFGTKTQFKNSVMSLSSTETGAGGIYPTQLIFGQETSSGAPAGWSIQSVNQGVAYIPLILQQNGSNVLIGTITNAGFKLDVNGTSRFSNNMTVTGSVTATNFTGSLFGTASWATNSLTSSYVLNAVSASFATTASYVLQAVSSSFASTASYVLNAISASFASTASYVLQAVSSSFASTASIATSSSFATTASYVLNAVSASFASTSSFVNTLNQAVIISGSLTVVTGSGIEFQVTDTGTKIGNIITDSHTITGSLGISGSTTITGSLTINTDTSPSQATGLTLRPNAGTHSPYITFQETNTGTNFNMFLTNQAGFLMWNNTSGKSIGLGGREGTTPKVVIQAREDDTGGTTLTVNTKSNTTVGIGINLTAAQTSSAFQVLNSSGTVLTSINNSGSLYINTSLSSSAYNLFVSGNANITNGLTVTGSVTATNFTGSLFGTASWATNALTASYVLNAISASFASTASGVTGGGSASFAFWNTNNTLTGSNIYRVGTNNTVGSTLNEGYIFQVVGSLMQKGNEPPNDGGKIILQSAGNSAILNVSSTTGAILAGRLGTSYLTASTDVGIVATSTFYIGTNSTTLALGSNRVANSIVIGNFAGSTLRINGNTTLTGSFNASGSSHTITGSLNAAIITGSLFGTSSWATNALTASYVLNAISASFASTASYINPLRQDVTITGSLFVSGGSTYGLVAPIKFNGQINNYTLAITDQGKMIQMNGALNGNLTLTVPSSSTVNFPIGTEISVINIDNASTTTITGSAGVTVGSSGGLKVLSSQYDVASLVKADTDTWYLYGDLS